MKSSPGEGEWVNGRFTPSIRGPSAALQALLRTLALAALPSLLRLVSRDRTQLVLESITFRHQLAIYKRSVGRPNITDRDGIFWLTVMRMLKDWRDAPVARPARRT